jgi:hypothetical protein
LVVSKSLLLIDGAVDTPDEGTIQVLGIQRRQIGFAISFTHETTADDRGATIFNPRGNVQKLLRNVVHMYNLASTAQNLLEEFQRAESNCQEKMRQKEIQDSHEGNHIPSRETRY